MRTILIMLPLFAGVLNAQFFTPFFNQYGLTATSERTPYWPVDTYQVRGTNPLVLCNFAATSANPELEEGEVLAFVWNPNHLSPAPPNPPPSLTPTMGTPLGFLIRAPGQSRWFGASQFVTLAPDAWGLIVPRVSGGSIIQMFFLGISPSLDLSFYWKIWIYRPR